LSDTYWHYIKDLIQIISEKSLDAKRDAEGSKLDFDVGGLMAYYEVLGILQQQANAFGIPLAEIGLDKIDRDRDLLGLAGRDLTKTASEKVD